MLDGLYFNTAENIVSPFPPQCLQLCTCCHKSDQSVPSLSLLLSCIKSANIVL